MRSCRLYPDGSEKAAETEKRRLFLELVDKKAKIAFGVLCCLLCCCLFMKPAAADTVAGSAGEKVTPPSIGQEEGAVEGIAFYYHRRYYRQRTSSGERYDPHKLTAAHPTLPLGSKVKVVNLANDRSVVVRVNDRCRRQSYELIDVSQAAAQKLGFYGKGRARVRIVPLSSTP